MVRAWYMNDSKEDQRLEHQLDPPQYITLSDIFKKSGVLYHKIDADHYETDPLLLKLKMEYGIGSYDFLEMSKDTQPDFEDKVKMFYSEHLHEEKEIRLILEGSYYFDIRDFEDRWIRMETTKGDLLILPAGIYHRGTVDVKNNYAKLLRLFVGDFVWDGINRPADDHPSRQAYIKNFSNAIKSH